MKSGINALSISYAVAGSSKVARVVVTGGFVFRAFFPARMKNKTISLAGGKSSLKNKASCEASTRADAPLIA